MVLKDKRTGIELKFFELSLKILGDLGLEFYDLDWNPKSGLLSLFIMDKLTKSALISDCVKVDKAFDPYIESETWIPDNLTLEVSSPGIFRELTSIEHFKSVLNEDITLLLNKKIDETIYPDFPKSMVNNLKLKVKLEEVKESSIIFRMKEMSIEIPFSQIKKANLETNFNNNQNISEENREPDTDMTGRLK